MYHKLKRTQSKEELEKVVNQLLNEGGLIINICVSNEPNPSIRS